MDDIRLYSKEHAWIRDNGTDCMEVGLSDYAIKQLDGVAYVAFETQEGELVKAGEIIASIESRKAVDALHSPIDGIVKVLAAHIETDPSCLEDCDGDWTLAIIQLKGNKPADLMSRREYDEYCKTL